MRSFAGILQADAYSGFAPLYGDERIVEAACWAHARRKYYDVYVVDRSSTGHEPLECIGGLYAIEREIRRRAPKDRLAQRRPRSAPHRRAAAMASRRPAAPRAIPGELFIEAIGDSKHERHQEM